MSTNQTESGFSSFQAYAMAVVCLAVGVLIGYLFKTSASPGDTQAVMQPGMGAPAQMQQQMPPQGMGGGAPAEQQAPPQMMAKLAEPILAKLKADPKNEATLIELGNLYYDYKYWKEATGYYEQALAVNPKNADVRTDMGTAFWYMGEADRAIAEFKTALQTKPNHQNALFNMGMVQWQGKGDTKAAIEVWETLVKTNPNAPEMAEVKRLIEQAKKHSTKG